jgi:hypothetical protein
MSSWGSGTESNFLPGSTRIEVSVDSDGSTSTMRSGGYMTGSVVGCRESGVCGTVSVQISLQPFW